MELSELIQNARVAQEISVEDLARTTGYSMGSIKAWEQGRRDPSVKALKKLIASLDLKGRWVAETVWVAADGTSFPLSLGKGHPKRKSVVVEMTETAMDTDSLIDLYAKKAEQIYTDRTAGDYTWEGFLSTFLREAKRL